MQDAAPESRGVDEPATTSALSAEQHASLEAAAAETSTVAQDALTPVTGTDAVADAASDVSEFDEEPLKKPVSEEAVLHAAIVAHEARRALHRLNSVDAKDIGDWNTTSEQTRTGSIAAAREFAEGSTESPLHAANLLRHHLGMDVAEINDVELREAALFFTAVVLVTVDLATLREE